MNSYMKLLADLANVDEVIKDKDKALILLSSLPDEEYEILILTLINGKSSLRYNDVSAAFVNHEMRRKDKVSSSDSITAEVLTAREISSNHRKGKGDVGKSKAGNCKLRKNQCVFCKEEGFWKIDCPRLKKKKKESKLEANIAQVDDGTDSDSLVFSLYFSFNLLLRSV